MPQINIEYSANLPNGERMSELALALHQALPAIIDSDLDSFKTRLTRLDAYVIGDGGPGHAMLHIDLRILTGRTEAVKTAAGKAALELAAAYVGAAPASMDVQITVEVGALDRANYHKQVLTG